MSLLDRMLRKFGFKRTALGGDKMEVKKTLQCDFCGIISENVEHNVMVPNRYGHYNFCKGNETELSCFRKYGIFTYNFLNISYGIIFFVKKESISSRWSEARIENLLNPEETLTCDFCGNANGNVIDVAFLYAYAQKHTKFCKNIVCYTSYTEYICTIRKLVAPSAVKKEFKLVCGIDEEA